MNDTDHVVLLDDEGRAIGTAPKSSVHGTDTALHLAFSCHVINDEGRVLVTRRALGKTTWPGVWSNSFCGHPRPAEPVLTAVHRRAEYELGITLTDIELALPLFRYRAVDTSGIVEHEVCPVYTARTTDEPLLNPLEVVEAKWVDPADLGTSLPATPVGVQPVARAAGRAAAPLRRRARSAATTGVMIPLATRAAIDDAIDGRCADPSPRDGNWVAASRNSAEAVAAPPRAASGSDRRSSRHLSRRSAATPTTPRPISRSRPRSSCCTPRSWCTTT